MCATRTHTQITIWAFSLKSCVTRHIFFIYLHIYLLTFSYQLSLWYISIPHIEINISEILLSSTSCKHIKNIGSLNIKIQQLWEKKHKGSKYIMHKSMKLSVKSRNLYLYKWWNYRLHVNKFVQCLIKDSYSSSNSVIDKFETNTGTSLLKITFTII